MKTQKIITTILSYLLGVFLLLGAYNHIAKPEMYSAMIPSFIPEIVAHIFAVITEVAVGIALLIPKYRKWGGLGFALLMIAFLPLHIWDLVRENHAENPLISTSKAAYIRFAVQIILIVLGWWIYKVNDLKTEGRR